MPTDLVSIVTNSSPVVATVGGFLWYLMNHAKEDAKERDVFYTFLKDYMQHQTDAIVKLATKLDEQREMLKEMYILNKDQRDKLRKYEEAESRAKSKQGLRAAV